MSAITAKQAAAHLHMHPTTIRRLAKLNKIPHRRVGGRLKFPPPEALDRWLAGDDAAPAQAWGMGDLPGAV